MHKYIYIYTYSFQVIDFFTFAIFLQILNKASGSICSLFCVTLRSRSDVPLNQSHVS